MSRSNGSYHPVSSELLALAAEEEGHDDKRPGDLSSNPALRARDREIAIITHELRNSLAVVRGAARMLQTAGNPESIESARALIERHAGHMGRHIDDLLDHGGGEGRGQTLQFARADLRKYAGYALDAATPDLRRRAHQLSISVPAQPVWVYGDGERLEQVFANILMNAAKYTPDGGKIALTMEHADGWVDVRICDSGMGMTSALLPRIFDMFVQADDSASAVGHGQGIGLAVVRNLVIQHGGSVKATSAGLGLGSELTVRLPTL
jgi:signal transduction histidine kinase